MIDNYSSNRKKTQIGSAISEYLPIVSFIITLVVGGVTQFSGNLTDQSVILSKELAGIGSNATFPTSGSSGNSSGGSTGNPSGGYSGNPSGGSAGNPSGGTSGNPSGGTSGNPSGGTSGNPSGGTSGNPSGGSSGNPASGSSGNPAGGTSGGSTTGGSTSGQNTSNLQAALHYVSELVRGAWDGIKSQFWDLVNFVLHPIDTANQLKTLAVGLYTDFKGTVQAIIDELGSQYAGLLVGDPYTIGKVIGENVSPAALGSIASKISKLGKIKQATKKIQKGCSSFLAGTDVFSEKGIKSIESLVVGDRIHVRSDETFEDDIEAITSLRTRKVDHYYIVDTGKDSISVTEEHPFWLQGKGWVPVKDLEPGNAVATKYGDILVRKITYIDRPAQVYNFTVGEKHTYFVSVSKIWVHNANESFCNTASNVQATKLSVDDLLTRVPAAKKDKLRLELNDPKNKQLKDDMLADPNMADAWNLLDDTGHNQIKLDPTAVKNLTSLLYNPKLSTSGLNRTTIKDIYANIDNAKGRAPAMGNLASGLDTLVGQGTTFSNMQHIINDLKGGGNLPRGAGYILKAVTENPAEFGGKQLKFEYTTRVGETNRRTDVVVGNTYYEFKSNPNVPPPDFAKQFAQDLANPKISDLNQIQWRFDSTVHSGFGAAEKKAMLDTIKTANITPDVALKYGYNNKADLINAIDANFNSIFQVQ